MTGSCRAWQLDLIKRHSSFLSLVYFYRHSANDVTHLNPVKLIDLSTKGRHQHSLPLTTNFSQKLTQLSQGISTQLVTFAGISQNRLCPLPIHYIVIRYPQQMVQMAFCDLSHTYHKQVTNVSQHVFVTLLWGILMSPPLIGMNLQVSQNIMK